MENKAVILSSYEFMKRFNSEEKCVKFLENILWKHGIRCGYCKAKEVSKKNAKTGFFQCKKCRKKFNVRTGTIFHRSKIELSKWLYSAYLLQTARKGLSSLQLSKQIGVTQKTAWFMLHRLREACKYNKDFKLSGEVQVDETYFGGIDKNKKLSKRSKNKWEKERVMVQGLRSGNKVKTHIVNNKLRKTLIKNIEKNVVLGSHIMTDETYSYRVLKNHFLHSSVKHIENQYYKQGTTTNGIESVWSLMKRGYKGIYHHWSKKHLHRYLNEFTFRLDKGNCSISTMNRIESLIRNTANRRLTYETLSK